MLVVHFPHNTSNSGWWSLACVPVYHWRLAKILLFQYILDNICVASSEPYLLLPSSLHCSINSQPFSFSIILSLSIVRPLAELYLAYNIATHGYVGNTHVAHDQTFWDKVVNNLQLVVSKKRPRHHPRATSKDPIEAFNVFPWGLMPSKEALALVSGCWMLPLTNCECRGGY